MLQRLEALAAGWRARPMLVSEARKRLGVNAAEEALALGMMYVYQPRDQCLWLALPLSGRSTMLPF